MTVTAEQAQNAEVEVAYKRYLDLTYGDLSDPARLAAYMYSAGFRAAIAVMIEFQDLPDQARRMERRVRAIATLLEDMAERP